MTDAARQNDGWRSPEEARNLTNVQAGMIADGVWPGTWTGPAGPLLERTISVRLVLEGRPATHLTPKERGRILETYARLLGPGAREA
jgi:hypothetical protein